MYNNDLADKAEKADVPTYEIGNVVVLNILAGGVSDVTITYNETYVGTPNIFFTNDSYTASIGISVTGESSTGCTAHVYNPSNAPVSITLHYLVIK